MPEWLLHCCLTSVRIEGAILSRGDVSVLAEGSDAVSLTAADLSSTGWRSDSNSGIASQLLLIQMHRDGAVRGLAEVANGCGAFPGAVQILVSC